MPPKPNSRRTRNSFVWKQNCPPWIEIAVGLTLTTSCIFIRSSTPRYSCWYLEGNDTFPARCPVDSDKLYTGRLARILQEGSGGKTGTFEILMTEKPSIRLTFSAGARISRGRKCHPSFVQKWFPNSKIVEKIMERSSQI